MTRWLAVVRANVLSTGAVLALCTSTPASGEKSPASANPANVANANASISTRVFPDAPERALVVRACAACHAPELVVAKRHTPEEWDDIIAKMVDRGAVANEQEQQRILEYLARFYGPA